MNLVLSLIVPVFGTNATKFDALVKIGETEIRGTNAILENKIHKHLGFYVHNSDRTTLLKYDANWVTKNVSEMPSRRSDPDYYRQLKAPCSRNFPGHRTLFTVYIANEGKLNFVDSIVRLMFSKSELWVALDESS